MAYGNVWSSCVSIFLLADFNKRYIFAFLLFEMGCFQFYQHIFQFFGFRSKFKQYSALSRIFTLLPVPPDSCSSNYPPSRAYQKMEKLSDCGMIDHSAKEGAETCLAVRPYWRQRLTHHPPLFSELAYYLVCSQFLKYSPQVNILSD